MAKLARTRSGSAAGIVSNETALGALAMSLLVFQGGQQPQCWRAPDKPADAHSSGCNLTETSARHGYNSTLNCAGTALSLTLRYSRTQEGPHYLASVAVIYTEAIKLVICLLAQILLCR